VKLLLGCQPHVACVLIGFAHLDPISVTSFVLPEFFTTTKTIRTKIDTISNDTRCVGTLDPYGMCEIGQTSVALCLYARLVDCWGKKTENECEFT
jgi:hypothetical protein